MEKVLPKGWVETKISELTDVVAGGTPSTSIKEYFDGDVPWITPADLSKYKEKYIKRGKRNITELGLSKSSAKLMPKGTVLFSSRAPIGYIVIAANAISTNQGFKNLIPNEFYESSFAFYYLKHIKDYAESQASGTTFKELSGKKMKELPFLLPPLAEQKRIVAKLDSLFGHLEKLKTKLDRIPGLLKDFRQSVLTQAVTGKLTEEWRKGKELEDSETIKKNIKENFKAKYKSKLNTVFENSYPEIWWQTELGNIISVKSGDSLSAKNRKEGKTPVFGGNGITGYHNTGNVEVKTIVIGRVGFYCGSIHETPKEAWITDNAFITTFPKQQIKQRFLFILLKATNLRKNDSATAQPVISGSKIYPLEVGIPSHKEQTEIVRRVESLFSKADRIATQYESLKKQIEVLPQAILAKAFRGELVEQLPSDGDAGALLEEIRKLREEMAAEKKKTSKRKGKK